MLYYATQFHAKGPLGSGVPPTHEYNQLHPTHHPGVKVRRALMNEGFMIVWAVARALLQRIVQPQTLVARLQVLLKYDPQVQRLLQRHLLKVLVPYAWMLTFSAACGRSSVSRTLVFAGNK